MHTSSNSVTRSEILLRNKSTSVISSLLCFDSASASSVTFIDRSGTRELRGITSIGSSHIITPSSSRRRTLNSVLAFSSSQILLMASFNRVLRLSVFNRASSGSSLSCSLGGFVQL
ncbi:uncharacterized protein DC041_0006359 [Schistosoma bovis]|uniref:Uncharacterized protein n=1 Tax=Schistosoma bovis TaxID=6184 RepID=A0A430PYE5_SCHBO|nr:uncharacterized protein DC041_0006359 [Schistosoma bovis]